MNTHIQVTEFATTLLEGALALCGHSSTSSQQQAAGSLIVMRSRLKYLTILEVLLSLLFQNTFRDRHILDRKSLSI